MTRDRGPGLPEGLITITDDGARVLAGAGDAVRLHGIDRGLGGVHLLADRLWRWDRSTRRLVPECTGR